MLKILIIVLADHLTQSEPAEHLYANMVYKETMGVQQNVNTAKLNDATRDEQPLETEKG